MNMNLSATSSRIQKWNLKKLTTLFVLFAVIISLVTSYFWYNQIYMTPERRFWSAINNSMATPSVVRTLTEGGSANGVVQKYRFNYAPQRIIENTVDFTERDRSANTNTSIRTEGVITPSAQYLRYTNYSSQAGNDLNEVLGTWAVQEVDSPEQLDQARLNFVSEYVTLAVFGNFDAKLRANMLDQLKEKNVYATDFSNVVEQVVDDEEAYVYNVAVNLREYAGMLQQAFRDAGLGEFPPLDPEQYREGVEVNAQFVVRSKDNSIVKISFGGREETYSNYGVDDNVEIPEADISITELQQKVQEQLQ